MTALAWSFLAACVVIVGLAAAVVRLSDSQRRQADRLATIVRRFSECMDGAPFCAFIKDAEGRSIDENRRLVEITRQALPHITSFLGRTDLDFFPAAQAGRYMDDDREVLRRGRPLVLENSSVDADGSVRRWSSLKFPWIDDQGRTCVAGVSFELTEIEQAREAAKESEDRCALALEAGRMGTMTLDLATRSITTSPLFAVLHGRPATKTSLTFEESLAEVHPDDRRSILAAVETALQGRAPGSPGGEPADHAPTDGPAGGGDACRSGNRQPASPPAASPPPAGRMTYRIVKPDGTVAWIEFVGQIYADEDGRPATVRGVGFDVTERQNAYEELARRKAILRGLIEVQENERQTLCHELHDGMMQYAIGAKMLLEAVRDDAGSAVQAERIDAALECLNRGIAEGRQVIRGVRSAVLDDLGLVAAIRDLADQMAAFGITVAVVVDERVDELGPALRTTVYRVVQESLTNIRKHAGTDRADVEVRFTPIDVRLRVSDRGRGFDVGAARHQGFGLIGMTERVRLAGGTCTIESRPGGGSRIDARLPIATAASDAAGESEAGDAGGPAFPASGDRPHAADERLPIGAS